MGAMKRTGSMNEPIWFGGNEIISKQSEEQFRVRRILEIQSISPINTKIKILKKMWDSRLWKAKKNLTEATQKQFPATNEGNGDRQPYLKTIFTTLVDFFNHLSIRQETDQ